MKELAEQLEQAEKELDKATKFYMQGLMSTQQLENELRGVSMRIRKARMLLAEGGEEQ